MIHNQNHNQNPPFSMTNFFRVSSRSTFTSSVLHPRLRSTAPPKGKLTMMESSGSVGTMATTSMIEANRFWCLESFARAKICHFFNV